eukprot:11222357-Lingulodinium_polyedra.AAC.1
MAPADREAIAAAIGVATPLSHVPQPPAPRPSAPQPATPRPIVQWGGASSSSSWGWSGSWAPRWWRS